MAKVDAHLLAMARGEIEPEDPFGGLIPIYDDELESDVLEDFGASVPTIRMSVAALVEIPLSDEAAFFLALVDGRRTVDELVALCASGELGTLEIIDELLNAGAIELE